MGRPASGKGTLAKRLAKAYELPHLDTGLLYRATARAVLDAGHDIQDAAAVHPRPRGPSTRPPSTRPDCAARTMGEAASVVAAVAEVRAALVEAQRAFAHRPSGAVLDGRDIGTVICPDAAAKIFVVASAEARARRRLLELEGRGEPVDPAAVLDDIRRRDARDMGRSSAPLRRAEDAVELDTTHLDVEAAFTAALRIVRLRLAVAGQASRTS